MWTRGGDAVLVGLAQETLLIPLAQSRVKWQARTVGCLEDREQPTLTIKQLPLDPDWSGWIAAHVHLITADIMFCWPPFAEGQPQNAWQLFDCWNYVNIYVNIFQRNTKWKFVFPNHLKQMFVNWHNCWQNSYFQKKCMSWLLRCTQIYLFFCSFSFLKKKKLAHFSGRCVLIFSPLPFFFLKSKLVPWYHLIGVCICVYDELFGHQIILCLATSSFESQLCLCEATSYNPPASFPPNSHALAVLYTFLCAAILP